MLPNQHKNSRNYLGKENQLLMKYFGQFWLLFGRNKCMQLTWITRFENKIDQFLSLFLPNIFWNEVQTVKYVGVVDF